MYCLCIFISYAQIVDFKNHDQTKMSKDEVLRKLATCAIGLNVSFVVTGILQERMLTQPYQGEYFTSSYGLVFLNRLGGFIISALLFYFTDPPHTTAVISEFSFPSVYVCMFVYMYVSIYKDVRCVCI
jgi:drug/metabolite transporter (DMT)-like permease